MAPIAIADSNTTTTSDIGQRIGQLKLNVTPAPAAAPVVQQPKKQEVRVVDPFNYVVRPIHSCLTIADGKGRNVWRYRFIIRVCRLFTYVVLPACWSHDR